MIDIPTKQLLIDGTADLNQQMFDPTYTIVMLGTSGVGKTIFMYVMLQELLDNYKGFSIKTSANDDVQIRQNYQSIAAGSELPGTAIHQEWEFDILYQHEKLFRFRWIDYRGGALERENIKVSQHTDFDKIYDAISQAQAILILADVAEYQKDPAKVHYELALTRRYIEHSLAGMKRGVHLILVLTKCDAVCQTKKWFTLRWDSSCLINECRKVFWDSFASMVNKYNHVLCDIVPISSYGKSGRLSSDGIIKVDPSNLKDIRPPTSFVASKVTKLDDLRINSFQITVPMMLIFDSILKAQQSELLRHKDQWRFLHEEAEKKLKKLKSRSLWQIPLLFNKQARKIKDDLQHQIETYDIGLTHMAKRANLIRNALMRIDKTQFIHIPLPSVRQTKREIVIKGIGNQQPDFLFTRSEEEDYNFVEFPHESEKQYLKQSILLLTKYFSSLIKDIGYYSFGSGNYWVTATTKRTERKDRQGRSIYELSGNIWHRGELQQEWFGFTIVNPIIVQLQNTSLEPGTHDATDVNLERFFRFCVEATEPCAWAYGISDVDKNSFEFRFCFVT